MVASLSGSSSACDYFQVLGFHLRSVASCLVVLPPEPLQLGSVLLLLLRLEFRESDSSWAEVLAEELHYFLWRKWEINRDLLSGEFDSRSVMTETLLNH